jgi:hypothetical protein
MAGRHCSICSNLEKIRLAADMIAAGAPDQAVADAIGAGRMAVARHRQNHLIKPMADRLAIMNKGAGPQQERQQLAAAAATDTPTPQQFVDAFLGLKAQAEKLQRIEERLERMAALAEANESASGVAQIAGQQLRGVEVGAKLAGAGGYAPQKLAGGAEGMFSVTIVLGEGRTETISVASVATAGLGAGEDKPPSGRLALGAA